MNAQQKTVLNVCMCDIIHPKLRYTGIQTGVTFRHVPHMHKHAGYLCCHSKTAECRKGFVWEEKDWTMDLPETTHGLQKQKNLREVSFVTV